MNPEKEKQVIATIYDSLYDIITYRPQNSNVPNDPINPTTTFLHLAKNAAIEPSEFDNLSGPSNPDGNLAQSENFSRLVDSIPNIQTEYVPRAAGTVSQNYRTIILGANSDDTPDPEQLKIYEQARDYLNVTREVKDFKGNIKKVTEESEGYTKYLENRENWLKALAAYRFAYAGYNLNDSDEQKKWLANATLLQAAIDTQFSRFRSGDAALIEEALAAQDTSINSAIRQVLLDARTVIENGSLPSLVSGSPEWLLSYPIPGNWVSSEASKSFGDFSIRSSLLKSSFSSKFTSYGGGASWGAGLWSVGGGASSSTTSEHFHMDTEDFELTAKVGVVRVMRPWFNGSIFNLKKWFLSGISPGGISNGKLDGNQDGLLPLLPVSFVVARDIEIKTKFSETDRTFLQKQFSASASVGWGPFQVSGRYSSSSTESTFKSEVNEGGMKVPGLQIIAWVSSIVPTSPPQ